MAALYLHLPFLPNKNGYSSTVTEALVQEMIMRKPALSGQTITSVYLGGEDLFQYPMENLSKLLSAIQCHFAVDRKAELSIEVEPSKASIPYFALLRQLGFNRVVLNIQSFDEATLAYLNQPHDANKAEHSILAAKHTGFYNCSVSLIYGIPAQSSGQWMADLELASYLDVAHIAATAFSAEWPPQLESAIGLGQLPSPDQHSAERAFQELRAFTRKHHYTHYDLVNLAKPGSESRQNLAYSSGADYLGIGPGAHSSFAGVRAWNCYALQSYLNQVSSGELPFEQEILSGTDLANEHLMLGLRTNRGVDLNQLAELLPASVYRELNQRLSEARRAYRLYQPDQRVFFEPDYWLEVDDWLSWFLVSTD